MIGEQAGHTQPAGLHHAILPRLPHDDDRQYIQSQLSDAIEDVRLEAYNIRDLDKILDEVQVDLSLQVLDIDKEATRPPRRC